MEIHRKHWPKPTPFCAPTRDTAIAESRMLLGNHPDWTDFELTFKVPDSNCRAQFLLLYFDARSASEKLVSGSMWFDDLQILRAAEPTKAEIKDKLAALLGG